MSTTTTAPRKEVISKTLVVAQATKKDAAGSYSFTVTLVGYQVPTTVLRTGKGYRSRDIASRRCKAWVRYYQACQRKGLKADIYG